MEENKVMSKIPEVRATRILEDYEGFNNYILGLKKKMMLIIRLKKKFQKFLKIYFYNKNKVFS